MGKENLFVIGACFICHWQDESMEPSDIAAVVTLPFDVIKTRRQIELGETELLGKRPVTKSTWKMMRSIYSREGFLALYTGLLPRLLKVAPSCAIMISSYESFKYFFSLRSKKFAEEAEKIAVIPEDTDMIQTLPGPCDIPAPYTLSVILLIDFQMLFVDDLVRAPKYVVRSECSPFHVECGEMNVVHVQSQYLNPNVSLTDNILTVTAITT
ncbi:hypothetical protein Btru_028701 [Bulinus truncatus]|nr:hypothetical protein Btru_028701 [Bulinus truncatus]